MSKPKKTWILVRGCQYQPGGAISLGQLLTKPFEPGLPLLPDGPLSIDPAKIERTHQTSVEVGSHSSLGASFQFWANIDMLPVQSNVMALYHGSNTVSWSFDKLDSEIMIPSIQNVQQAVNRDEVVTQINRKKFDFRKRIYMITGVRVAKGARLNRQTSRTVGGDSSKIGVDLATLAAAPISLGPGAAVTNKASDNYSFGAASDFVYAYRVCEVHYGKDVYVKPYNRGDTFGLGKGSQETHDTGDSAQKLQRMVVEKVSPEDYDGFGIAHKSWQTDGSDEDETFLVAE